MEEGQGSRPKTQIGLLLHVRSPYASAPIKAIKDQAALLGIEVAKDQDVSLTALDAKSQVLAAKGDNATICWHGNTTMSVATAVKDAYALKLGADHIVNNWGFDKNLVRMTGAAGEGVIGACARARFSGMTSPYHGQGRLNTPRR